MASHIIEYASNFTTFEQVNREFILGFIGYLKTAQNFNYKKKGEIVRLVPNTQHNLFIKFSYIIKKAFKEGIITINPLEKLEHSDKPRSEKGQREYLIVDEIKKLIRTECSNEMVKKSFIFCCLSRLRYSDVSNITWGDLWQDNSHNTI